MHNDDEERIQINTICTALACHLQRIIDIVVSVCLYAKFPLYVLQNAIRYRLTLDYYHEHTPRMSVSEHVNSNLFVVHEINTLPRTFDSFLLWIH